MTGQIGKLVQTGNLKLAQQASRLHVPLSAAFFQALAHSHIDPGLDPKNCLIAQLRRLGNAIKRQDNVVFSAKGSGMLDIFSVFGDQTRAADTVNQTKIKQAAHDRAAHSLAEAFPRRGRRAAPHQKSAARQRLHILIPFAPAVLYRF
jgi:hypothetical protein